MRRPRQRALLGLVAVVLLLAAVAIASTGSVPTGSGITRRPSDRILDVAFSLFVVAMAFGVLLWGYVLVIRRDVVSEAAGARRRQSRWAMIAGLAIGLGLVALIARWGTVGDRLRARFATGSHPRSPAPVESGSAAAGDYRPEFATGPVLVVVGLLSIVAAVWYLSYRRRRRRLGPLPESVLPTLADVLDETLDDLRAETDPRRAVIAAYARMERALAAFGLPRAAAEAPDEYLRRIFSDLDVSRNAISRLTALFSRAKFSTHEVAAEMKQEAIAALEAVREELRTAEIVAEVERTRAFVAVERTTG